MENFENKNLSNKTNVKKANLRNYDENPIVICDKTVDCINFSIVIQIVIIFKYLEIVFNLFN